MTTITLAIAFLSGCMFAAAVVGMRTSSGVRRAVSGCGAAAAVAIMAAVVAVGMVDRTPYSVTIEIPEARRDVAIPPPSVSAQDRQRAVPPATQH